MREEIPIAKAGLVTREVYEAACCLQKVGIFAALPLVICGLLFLG